MEYYGKLQKAIDAVEHVIIGKDEGNAGPDHDPAAHAVGL